MFKKLNYEIMNEEVDISQVFGHNLRDILFG